MSDRRLTGRKRGVFFFGVGLLLSAIFGWPGLAVVLVLWAAWEVAG